MILKLSIYFLAMFGTIPTKSRYFALGQSNHVPQFYRHQRTIKMEEEEPVGTYVMRAKAQDTEGDDIVFSILEDNGYFRINSTTGVVLLAKRIDRDTMEKPMIQFTIVVSELEEPSRNSEQKIDVIVMDINDNKPKFEKESYFVNISESATQGTFVTILKATDADDPQSTELLYTIFSGNEGGYFYCDHYEGKIRTTKQLDYETQSHFELTLQVADLRPTSSDRKVSYCKLYIFVLDEDDLGAVFDGNYSVSVLEGRHDGKRIAEVKARDGDKARNAAIKYSIDPSSKLFFIDPALGYVYVNGDLDREKQSTYVLQLLATETRSEGPFVVHEPGKAKLVINVLDVNDNSPVFEQSLYSVDVKEHVPKGSIILTVTAKDKDMGKNCVFEYMLEGHSGAFGISQKGEIFVAKDLDREQKYDYRFMVVARQSGRSDSKAMVRVIVKDENDHDPVFLQKFYEKTIPENSPIGTHVTQVSAADNDFGHNAAIEYRIVPDAEGHQYFDIDRNNGNIKTRFPLDRETKPFYLLQIEASDKGIEVQRRAIATLKIIIEDKNDNSPEFTQHKFIKIVHYDEVVSTPLVTLTAKDADEGSYGEVTYRIVDGNEDGRFHIDANTGELKVGDALAAYSGRKMKIEIEAFDNHGNFPSSVSTKNAMVEIKIQKIGENSVVLSLKKPLSFVLANEENIESDLKLILAIGIEVDKIERSLRSDSTNFIFHGYDEQTQVVVKKDKIIRSLQSPAMNKFRIQWNVTYIYPRDTVENILVTKAPISKPNDKWSPIIYAVLGFSALIAVFGMIGIIYLVKSKRRSDDGYALSHGSSRIPIAAREQARNMWNDDNFESVSQVGPAQSYVHSSGFLTGSCDRYELDPSNLYEKQDPYRDDPFSEVGQSPSHSSDGSGASSGFAASSVLTVLNTYTPLSHSSLPRDSRHRRSRAQTKESFISPRDKRLSVILDDDGKTKTILENHERRPPSYEYDFDEKLPEQYDCDV